MNRAKKPGGSSAKRFSNETQRYWGDAQEVVVAVRNSHGLKARLFDTAIFERVGIKRAIQEGMPAELNQQFQGLWKEIEEFIEE
jgi:chromosome partitioning protein